MALTHLIAGAESALTSTLANEATLLLRMTTAWALLSRLCRLESPLLCLAGERWHGDGLRSVQAFVCSFVA